MFTDTYVLKEWLRESARHFEKTKAFSKKVRNYYNGDQLDDWIKRVLANRGQPEQYENQIAKHHNAVIGHKQERDIEIKLFAQRQEDRNAAHMLNALLQSIRAASDYELESDDLDDELGIEGVAIAELSVDATGEHDRFGREHKDVSINAVPSREAFLDPFSKSKDYNSDARYLHRAFWIDKEDLYGLGFDEDKIRQLSNLNYMSEEIEDDLHSDENLRERVLLTYTWYRRWDKEDKKDKYYYCFWSNDTILKQGESPYEFEGFPYEVEFYKRDFTGEIRYYGHYKHIMPLQDNINYAKLRLANMLGSQKTYIERESLIDEDIAQFSEENAMDNASIMVENINGIKDVKQHAQIQQILNTIIDNRNQIQDILNSNSELLGNADNRMSKVGQERRIKSGLVGLNPFTKKSDNLQKKITKKMVSLIGQYYDTERIVSIIDEDLAQDFMRINEPVTNEYGNVDFEHLPNGKVRPVENNRVRIGQYDLVYLARPMEDTASDERMRLNQELLRTVRETKPEYVDFVLMLMLKDMKSPDTQKFKQYIQQQKQGGQNQQVQQLQDQIQQLEMRYKQSQATLNNAKAKALHDKNKIELQKAFADTTIKREKIQEDKQKNLR